jgi:hypothetical protein
MCLLSRWLTTSNRDMLSIISNVFLSFQIALLCSNFISAIIVWSLWTSCAHTSRSTFTSYTGPTRTLSWKLSIDFLVHAYPLVFCFLHKIKVPLIEIVRYIILNKNLHTKNWTWGTTILKHCSTHMNIVASLSL